MQQILVLSICLPRWIRTVPFVNVSVLSYGPLRGTSSFCLMHVTSTSTLSPILYWCGMHFAFLLQASLSVRNYFCAFIIAQSALNLICNIISRPNTSCVGVACNVV
jgi:hypothetical protein